jgi:hypothetical protein
MIADFGSNPFSNVNAGGPLALAINVMASGTGSAADAAAIAVAGDVGSITVQAINTSADAAVSVDAKGDGVDIAQLTLAATGANAAADALINTGNGDLGFATISATAQGALAALNYENDASSGTGGSLGTVNATSATGAGVLLTLDLEGNSGGTINGSGAGGLNITLQAQSIGSVSAAAMTGPVVMTVADPTTADAAMSVTTGSSNDFVQGGMGVNTFDLGAGQNTFDFSNLDSVMTAPVAAVTDIIAGGFATGTGSALGFGGPSAILGTDFANAGNAAGDFSDLADYLTAANAYLTSAGGQYYYFGTIGSDGFLAYNDGVDANPATEIIQLVGVTAVNASDIVHIQPR